MTETPKTVFVTKWALTEGVVERDVQSMSGDYLSIKHPRVSYGITLGHQDWHTTREAAVSRANAMRDAKLKSLEAQLERIRGIAF